MGSENEVAVEEEKRVIGVTTNDNTKKDDEIESCCGEEVQSKNEESEGSIFAGDSVSLEASKKYSPSKNTKRAIAKVLQELYVYIYYYADDYLRNRDILFIKFNVVRNPLEEKVLFPRTRKLSKIKPM